MPSDLAILALKALDGLSTRAEVTARNIANAGTPGYRSLHVTFEGALSAAAGQGGAAVAGVSPRVDLAPPRGGSSALRLDLEMQTASATALRYAAVIQVLDREMQLRALALSQGK